MARALNQPETAPVELSDDRIAELLAEATVRLQAQEAREGSSQASKPKFSFPKLDAGETASLPLAVSKGIASINASHLPEQRTGRNVTGPRRVEDPVAVKARSLEEKKATAGSDWFNLPRTELTPELKRDLQLLKMRNILDPHRHYKKDGGKMQAPEFSQVGTVIEGPTEFYSGRIENKNRKRTFVEEVLAGEQETGRFKRKYNELQSRKTSGKKAFYKALQAKRKNGVSKGS